MLLKLEESWYGQPKYCYEKAIHVVMISFAVVLGLSFFLFPCESPVCSVFNSLGWVPRSAVWPKSDEGLSFGLKLGGLGGGARICTIFLKLEHQKGQCFHQEKGNVRRLTAKDRKRICRKRINQVNINLQS